jgi:1-acyl-sn-glycerol-3-phosphate acyltransferase
MPRTGGAKNPWFARIFRLYVAQRLRRNFSDLRLLGGEKLDGDGFERGFILACNHVAWWDPLLLIHLDAHLKTNGACLMDRENLRNFAFFRWLGAIPLDRRSSLSAHRDLKRAAAGFPERGRMLVIFPQGQQRPAHLPLDLKAGVAFLAATSGVPVVPLAIRYDFLQGPKAVVHLSLGSPIPPPLATAQAKTQFMRRLEGGLLEELRRIDDALLEDLSQGESLIGRDRNADKVGRSTVLSKVLNLTASGGDR